MSAKQALMVDFWSERAERFGTDPQANANDVWIREIEIASVAESLRAALAGKERISVLDFGCANGFSSLRLAEMFPNADFVSTDINPGMIANAKEALTGTKLKNLEFRCADILKEDFDREFDVIYCIRVFQNMDTHDTQTRYAQAVIGLLAPEGRFVYLECYQDGYDRLNQDRAKLGLKALPLHSFLTRLVPEFDEFVKVRLTPEIMDNPFSSYQLVTRMVYSWYAREMGEEIDYNHPLHRVAAILPSLGDYGPERRRVFRKA